MKTYSGLFFRTTCVFCMLIMWLPVQPNDLSPAPTNLSSFGGTLPGEVSRYALATPSPSIPAEHDFAVPFADPQESPCAGTGSILLETWTEIYDTRVSSIPWLTTPDAVSELTIFEAPPNSGDNFGSRVSGYLCVPTTGYYTFWIASDDHSELWLSPDEQRNHRQRIANVWGWTSPRQWDKYSSQKSSPVYLIAGQRYYIEGVYKEDEGADNMAVGWQLPDGTLERPIPGSRLTPYQPGPDNACVTAGIIRQEFWTGVPGTRVSEIPVDMEPDTIGNLNSFEGPISSPGDNYGTRIRGYICPPASGNYTFWVAGDDQTELWLSTDDDPVNKTRIAYHTGWTYKREWNKYATQQSAPVFLAARQLYYVEALMKEGTGADHLSVGWLRPDGLLQRPITGAHLVPFPGCISTGKVLVETWTDIFDTRVSSIPWLTPPDVVSELSEFEAPTNAGDNFGSRISGYICVPMSGDYTFWIASDDHSELWLSPDDQRNHRQRIANVWGWTRPQEWNKYPSQQSSPVHLIARRRYYIEGLYKEDEGADHMAVGWQLPDGTMERPIPGHRLARYDDPFSLASQQTPADSQLYSQIIVYPNPAKSGDSKLTIAGFEKIEESSETNIEIVNMTGEVVFTDEFICGGDCTSYALSLNKLLVPGVYVVNTRIKAYKYSQRLFIK